LADGSEAVVERVSGEIEGEQSVVGVVEAELFPDLPHPGDGGCPVDLIAAGRFELGMR
jgi:hypothetical protein